MPTKAIHFKSILMYKFPQDHLELLINKIRCRCGWITPNVLQFKYALRRILIRNSIEPSSTGNFTHFDDALHQPYGLFDCTVKRNQTKQITSDEYSCHVSSCETIPIGLDQETPNDLLNNVLYYISGFIVRYLLPKLKYKECRSELLLDADDPHSFKASEYPRHVKFTCFKQRGGLLFPSTAVLKIVKAAEVIFKIRVL